MERFVKSKFLLKTTYLEPEGDTIEDPDAEPKFKVVNSSSQWCRGADFQRSMAEDKAKGINHKIQYVRTEPSSFIPGVIYILLDGTKAWTYNWV